ARGAAPERAQRMGGRKRPQPHLDVDAGEGASNALRAFEARRSEGDDLVRPARDLDEPLERAPDVVADPEQRMAQGADVVRDSHLDAGWYRKRLKWAPRTRVSGLRPPVTRAGIAVGATVKSTRHRLVRPDGATG